MQLPTARFCRAWSIATTSGSPTERRIRTTQRGYEKRTCGGFNRQNTPNAFFRLIAPIAGHFQPRRHRLSAREYRAIFQDRFQQWNEVTGVKQVSYLPNIPSLPPLCNMVPFYSSAINPIPTNKLTIPFIQLQRRRRGILWVGGEQGSPSRRKLSSFF